MEDEETGKAEEYGGASVRTRATRRGGTTRSGRTTRRGIGRLRQTQRKQRSTVRSNRDGSQRLTEEGGIALAEIGARDS